jgi:hypothetical protein
MGLFIVRGDMRGRGLGRELWQWRRDRLLSRLEPGATIGMDGVYEVVPFYERGGFRAVHRHVRYQGTAAGSPSAHAVVLDAESWDEIERFDRRFVATPRPAFLRAWIAQPGTTVVGVRHDGLLTACGVARPCVTGIKIGPLFADDAAAAQAVVQSLMAMHDGQQVQIDVPDVNAAAVNLARDFGLTETFGCVRLYHGPAPPLPLDSIYGVTSLEFG